MHLPDFRQFLVSDHCCALLVQSGHWMRPANASYELTDAEYASNEAGDTWVDHLLGILVAMLQWLQPLLTPSNYDTLVASLLLKASPGPCMTARYWHQSCIYVECDAG